MIVYGPVPSRRLGRSLGVNNIVAKTCTYSCVYCQVGRTNKMTDIRKEFYDPEKIIQEIKEKIYSLKEKDIHVDYISFVPDGEPTLDINLGYEIEQIKKIGLPVAVITNSSLMTDERVRSDLKNADWVSLKIDTINQEIFNKINRPYKSINLDEILNGITDFSNNYDGIMVTETMLVDGINDEIDIIEDVAVFLEKIKPKRSYISIPIRPPAERWVKKSNEKKINNAYQVFKDHKIDVELITGYEGNEFSYVNDIEKELLSILSVHPMTKDAIKEFLKKAKIDDFKIIGKMLAQDKIVEINYSDKTFYLRKI